METGLVENDKVAFQASDYIKHTFENECTPSIQHTNSCDNHHKHYHKKYSYPGLPNTLPIQLPCGIVLGEFYTNNRKKEQMEISTYMYLNKFKEKAFPKTSILYLLKKNIIS